jgi:hypothetical protein
MAIDKRVTATEYLEQALKEKLERDKYRRMICLISQGD